MSPAEGQVAQFTIARSKVHSEAIKAGEAGEFEVVSLDALKVDHSYQRDLDVNLVQKIARDWDIAAAGPIVCNRRDDGSLYVVNGQHRAAAAKTAGEMEIIAQVTQGLSQAEEAELRLKGNTRRTDKVQERFRAQLAALHPESLAIVDIAGKFGTRINPWPDTKHGINAVSTIEELYRKDRGGHLVRVLEFIQEAFGQADGPNVTTAALKGVSWLLERHDTGMDRKRMVERLGVEGMPQLMRAAMSHRAALGGSLWMNYYRAMVGVYNERLPEGKRIEWRTTASAKRIAEAESGYAAQRDHGGQTEPGA